MSGEKMTEEKKMTVETKLFEEKKAADPFITGFFESMSKTNTEKITKEILEGLSMCNCTVPRALRFVASRNTHAWRIRNSSIYRIVWKNVT